ncbi:MAG: VWA domain-containing protein, partial [Myxococcota bacterium]
TTPLALFGLFLAAAPLVAHFTKRSNLIEAALPTIALVRKAKAAHRKKLNLVDLLLLIARVLVITTCVVGAAEPYAVTRLAYGDGHPLSLALVLDDSMSMLQRHEGTTALANAAARAEEVIQSLPQHSEVTVIAAGVPARVLSRRSTELLPLTEIVRSMASLETTGRGTELPEALHLARRELAASKLSRRRTLVLSDFAGTDWTTADWNDLDRVDLERFGAEGTVFNASVYPTKIPIHPGEDGSLQINFEVRTSGANRGEFPVGLYEENEKRVETNVVVEDGIGQGTFSLSSFKSSEPKLSLRLEIEDALGVDNRHDLLIRHVEPPRILLVNGDPSASGLRDEIGFLKLALQSAESERSTVSLRSIDQGRLSARDIAQADVIVMANCVVPPEALAREIRQRVQRGAGLLIGAGHQTHAQALNHAFGPILPARVRPPIGVRLDSWQPQKSARPPLFVGLKIEKHPYLKLSPKGLEAVRIHRTMGLEPHPQRGRVAASFVDDSAALVVGPAGKGQVALLSLTLDSDWSDLPLRPGYVPLMLKLISWLSPRAMQQTPSYASGAPVQLALERGAEHVQVTTPGGQIHHVTKDHVTEDHAFTASHASATFTETVAPGTYLVHSRSHESEPSSHSFLVVPPTAESALTSHALPERSPQDADATSDKNAQIPLESNVFALAGFLLIAEGLLRLRRPF